MELANQHTTTAAVPNGEKMVDMLLSNMTVDSQRLNAEISSVQGDTDPAGPRFDFERAVERLVPFDPVAERLDSRKRKSDDLSADVSQVTVDTCIDSSKSDTFVCKFYPPKQFAKLTKKQKGMLDKWRQSNGGRKLFEAQRDAWKAQKGDTKEKTKSRDKYVKVADMEVRIKSTIAGVTKAKDEEEQSRAILSEVLAEIATAGGKRAEPAKITKAADVILSKLTAIRSSTKESSE